VTIPGLFSQVHHEGQNFTGTDSEAVDKKVNEWLAESGVKLVRTNTVFKQFRDRGWDAIAGKIVHRRALGIAISVWYEEPNGQASKPSYAKRRPTPRAEPH
jgi:hypothetical protein